MVTSFTTTPRPSGPNLLSIKKKMRQEAHSSGWNSKNTWPTHPTRLFSCCYLFLTITAMLGFSSVFDQFLTKYFPARPHGSVCECQVSTLLFTLKWNASIYGLIELNRSHTLYVISTIPGPTFLVCHSIQDKIIKIKLTLLCFMLHDTVPDNRQIETAHVVCVIHVLVP